MPNKLKPCDCGNRGVASEKLNVFGDSFFCRCKNCGKITGTYNTEHQAIEAWNKRS